MNVVGNLRKRAKLLGIEDVSGSKLDLIEKIAALVRQPACGWILLSILECFDAYVIGREVFSGQAAIVREIDASGRPVVGGSGAEAAVVEHRYVFHRQEKEACICRSSACKYVLNECRRTSMCLRGSGHPHGISRERRNYICIRIRVLLACCVPHFLVFYFF
jgi:hypothetical protein